MIGLSEVNSPHLKPNHTVTVGMENYKKVQACFDKNNCKLLTSFEVFEEARKTSHKQSYQYVRVDFIGSCTHESSAVFTNFNLRKTGIYCKVCVNTSQSELLKKNKNTNQMEYNGIQLLEEYLAPYYEVVRTHEGCGADIAIRKKSDTEDKWIPVQVKTTNNICHGMYSFKYLNPSYKNMLLFCTCITEKKSWLLPFNDVSTITVLNISIKSKYNIYEVKSDTLCKMIDMNLEKIEYLALSTIMEPINPLQKREQLYFRKREQYLPFLEYTYPGIQGTVVDVLIYQKKVQEKVLGFIKDRNALQCEFASNNGKVDGKRTHRTYCLGENDYYWLHSSIDERFWIIPEQVLFERGLIASENEIKNKKVLCFKSENNKNNTWLNAFEYNYNMINEEVKDKIIKLFKNLTMLK